jgi:hypothetical protein
MQRPPDWHSPLGEFAWVAAPEGGVAAGGLGIALASGKVAEGLAVLAASRAKRAARRASRASKTARAASPLLGMLTVNTAALGHSMSDSAPRGSALIAATDPVRGPNPKSM